MKSISVRPFVAVAFLFLALGSGVPGQALATPSKHTANHVRGRSDSLLHKKISLDVGWVQPMRGQNTEELAFFVAHTWDEREKLPGGAIIVAVDSGNVKKFVARFDTAPDVEQRGWVNDLNTHRLTGFLREGTDGQLLIDMSSKEVAVEDIPPLNPLAEAFAEFLRELLEKQRQQQ